MGKQTATIQTELSRDLGLTSALAIGIGTMIAAGVFTLSGLAIRNVGSAAILSFLLAGTVAMFTALAYCEFTSIYPESGEGYLYARRTFSPHLAYIVGWMLLLSYTSSCAFYLASFSSYFQEFIFHAPFEATAGVASLVILTLLNIKGTKESGQFQIVVTIAKVVLLVVFILGGLRFVSMEQVVERFSHDISQIAGTAAMVFITFFGFSAIAATAGEVRDPVKTIPRAIFISMGVVTFLYTMVVFVMLAANLSEYTEAAMGIAAKQYLGAVGGFVIIGGAFFSMVSAANASIMAGSRVTLSMSRLRHLPQEIGAVNPQTRTPIVALMLVGGTILVFMLLLPLEDLAHFANIVMLLALSLVNAALVVHRRRYPDLPRPFRVPLVPLLPVLAILSNGYLIYQTLSHPRPVALAACMIALGVMGFVAWKGSQAEVAAMPGEPSRVAEGKYAVADTKFRVLVPLSNPGNVEQLITIASAIAAGRQGEVVALRVALLPEQVGSAIDQIDLERERPLLDTAQECARKHGVPVTTLISVAHHAARAILEVARERRCDLIILGWKGYSTKRERIMGEIVDSVVSRARRDIMLVKLVGDQPMRRLMLPTAGGEHALQAEQYAASLARFNDGNVTICTIPATGSEEDLAAARERLAQARERLATPAPPATQPTAIETELIERGPSISEDLLAHSQGYDAIIVGASGQPAYPRLLFGSVPEDIARKSDKTVIVVKAYHPVKALLGRVMED